MLIWNKVAVWFCGSLNEFWYDDYIPNRFPEMHIKYQEIVLKIRMVSLSGYHTAHIATSVHTAAVYVIDDQPAVLA